MPHDDRMPDQPDNPDGNDHDKPHDGEFDGATRLFIRTHPADDGSVPLAAGLAFWTSPDVVIVKPGGAVGGEAMPLQVNQVRVTVTNGGGIPAVDAYVDAFVSDPSTLITPATATSIGGGLVTVQAYMQATVDLPWTPQAGDTGHRCIIARVSLIFPSDTYTDPTIFDVVGDRHVAQRNIQVLEIPAGKAMTFRFQMGEVADGGRVARIRVLERTREMDARELTRAGGCVGGLPALLALDGLGVRTLTTREALGRPSLAGDVAPAFGVTRRPEGVPEEAEVRADLARGKQPRVGAVTFRVSPDDEPGRLHAVDVVQLDEATGEPVGGLTFVVRVV